MNYRVALDGPSGAGKSTIAKCLAKELGYVYVDTGAMYRAIGLFVFRKGKDTKDAKEVTECLKDINIEIRYSQGIQKIFLNGEDVSEAIRQNEISMAASNVSALKEVRAFLMDTQRNIAANNNVIMDGRDIGTVVLPNAEIKIFMVGKPEIRAQRRYKELCEKGQNITYQEVLRDIIQRDYNDSHRKEAPLKQAEDAVLLDTSDMTFDETLQAVLEIIKQKTN